MHSRRSPEEINEHLRSQKDSGLSKSQFYKDHSIKYTTFQSWSMKSKNEVSQNSNPFIKPPTTISNQANHSNYQIEIGSNSLLVPVGFNLAEAKTLIDLLSC